MRVLGVDMSETASADILDYIDPDIRTFVDRINEGYAALGGDGTTTMAERREIAERVREPWRTGGPRMAESRDFELNGLRMRLHRPTSDDALATMLYIHGGGWALFSIDTHDRLMREYASRAGIAVIGIDYSLAPEAKFPVALDEIVAAVEWLREHAADMGLDGTRIAVGGDSAGANLTVAACLNLRDAGRPVPQAMLLNYGAFAAEHKPSYARFGGAPHCLTADEMDGFWRDYLSDGEQLSNPLVAPLHADVHDLPPAFMAIAECDILADCNHELARKMSGAGVPVEAREYKRATHSFLEAMSISALARQALDDQAGWLRKALAG
jgi:acetyl esterase